MTTLTTFAPTVLIDGRTVQPKGWMWVLGFAFGGCQWAIEEADTPEFKAIVRESLKEMKNVEVEREIAALEKRIRELRKSLCP